MLKGLFDIKRTTLGLGELFKRIDIAGIILKYLVT